MSIKYKTKWFIFLFLFQLIFFKIKAKEIIIHNNDENFLNIDKILSHQDDKNVTVKFVDNYYDMSLQGYSMMFTITYNLNIMGNENGTIFDYNNQYKGLWKFSMAVNGLSLKIQNIIYENLSTNDVDYKGKQILYFDLRASNFQLMLNNCIFRNNKYSLIELDVFFENKVFSNKPKLHIKNCKF